MDKLAKIKQILLNGHGSPLQRLEAAVHEIEVVEALAAAESAGWKPIAENEFVSCKRFLVVTEIGIPFIAWRQAHHTWCSHGNPVVHPTHFMDLPTPPTKKEG